jgi:Ca2+-binding RTX toxin-like protein
MGIRLWRSETLVNTTISGGQFGSAVTELKTGGYVIAWVDDMGSAASVVKFQRFDAYGSKVGSETAVPQPLDGGDQDQVAITTLSNGNFVIVNRDVDATSYDGVYSIYDPSGNLLSQGQSEMQSTLAESEFTVSPTATGFAISYTYTISSTNSDPRVITYDSDGNSIQNFAIDLTESLQGSSSVAIDKATGSIAAVYFDRDAPASGGIIYLRTGTLAAGFSNPTIQIFTATFPVLVEDPHIIQLGPAIGASTLYAISYQQTISGITFNTFLDIRKADGTLVKQTIVDNAMGAELKGLADGSFVLTWRYPPDFAGVPRNLHLQQFDGAGNKIGSEMIVNTNGNEVAGAPSITQLSDGRLVVTWTNFSASSDGSVAAVNQQILDPRDGFVNGSNDPLLAEILLGHDTVADQIRGNRGNDTLDGLGGSDSLYGGDGYDLLLGGKGDDALYGGNGDDVLEGGTGADHLDGGANSAFGDAASYANSIAAVFIDLGSNTASGGDAVGDSFANIENLTGSSFNDEIFGSATTNRLDGGFGNDLLNGGAGSDFINGGGGQDVIVVENDNAGDIKSIDGGADRDLLDLSQITKSSIWIDLGYDLTSYKLFTSDSFASVGNIESIVGTQYGDNIRGDVGSNNISGGLGDDTILGYSPYDVLNPYASLGDVLSGDGGNDLLFSGTGNDLLNGGDGADTIEAGGGTDTIVTGNGSDTIIFSPRNGTDTIRDFSGYFEPDVIMLYNFGTAFDTFAEVYAASALVGSDTYIYLTETTIILQYVFQPNLDAGDFIFA